MTYRVVKDEIEVLEKMNFVNDLVRFVADNHPEVIRAFLAFRDEEFHPEPPRLTDVGLE